MSYLELLKLELNARRSSRGQFSYYMRFVNPQYDQQWFHKLIADKCQELYEGKIKKLMIFVPPQNGKALKHDTPILTTKGFKKHCELQAGEIVFNNKGEQVKVIANSGVYEWDCMDVQFAGGYNLIASNNHEWILNDTQKTYETNDIKKFIENGLLPSIDAHIFNFITPVGKEFVNCIQVDGGIYLAGMNLIPTHNSEIVTRQFPAWCFGNDPNLKIAGCSYAADLAETFCREIQRNIESDNYKRIFNDLKIGGDGYIKTLSMFEINGSKGFYKAVGVGGGITGNPVDIGIIDDPIKSFADAYSPTYRNRVWEWYNNEFLTRLHNNSKQILMMTRWHEDDLAGRLLKHEPDEWEVICLPAIKENDNNKYDIREIGEALWENRHSLERSRSMEKRSPRTFASLFQQRPSIDGGNIVKRDWFNIISLDRYNSISNNKAPQFFIDTAFTKEKTNDPSAIISCIEINGDLYIKKGQKVRYEFPEFIRFIKSWTAENNYHSGSAIRIEPKANGLSVIQQLKRETSLNVTNTPTPTESKEARLNAASVSIECGHVYLVDGGWVDEFIDEVCGFPAKPHDEYVDLLCYAIDYMQNKTTGIKNIIDYF